MMFGPREHLPDPAHGDSRNPGVRAMIWDILTAAPWDEIVI